MQAPDRRARRFLCFVLTIAAAALAGCASTPAPAPPLPPPAEAVPPPAPTLISIAAVGDIMLGTDFPKDILPDDDGAGFLRHVAPILSAADITFGNLEGVLMDGGEPVKQCGNPARCFLFRTPTRYASYLADAGFDMLSLANNHARDFGEAGRDSSMAALDAVGIRHSGREGTWAETTVLGVRIAMIAFAPNVGANSLNDHDIAVERVRALAAANDILIVSFHAGAEGDGAERLPFAREYYVGEDRGDAVMFAHAMVDAGADLLIGHGPHVARAMELYRDRLIAYSLGNFATYYGIGVEGNRGIAPILTARLDAEGRFRGGHIDSTIQLRPDGPSIDPQARVFALIQELTAEAFPDGALVFGEGGEIERR
jgi:poly-gamma-glutamate capsule biosynthesis protein CapA/YwtB (metallophosphatase superfamily)